jgi:ApbE superfamily uncharacterized protein (UPF0280 family)
MFEPRTYRHWTKGTDLAATAVAVGESDLYILAQKKLKREAEASIFKYRACLEEYIAANPLFMAVQKPIDVAVDAPDIVVEMAKAAQKCNVGPMAAVAGAIAEFVGNDLLAYSDEIIVENGGDLFLKILQKRRVGIYAAESPLTGKLALEVWPEETPLGICTSSGTVGHSLSYGNADAVIALSALTALADAAATAVGNMVKDVCDINRAMEFAKGIDGLDGIVVIKGSDMGVWGKVRLCKTN